MNRLEFQIVSESQQIPAQEKFKKWIDAILRDEAENSEVVIRIVDEQEMIQFNSQYRGKNNSTNILSFPFDPPEGVDSDLLGDLLVCAPVVEKEAKQQDKLLEHHWAHMIIHGVLHLIGYDHINDADAEEMEALEIKILRSIKIDDPYEEKNKS